MERSSSPSNPETRDVRLANETFYKAFESLDLMRMAEVWRKADHVRCVHPGGEFLSGYSTVIRSWEEIFAHTRSIRFELSDVRVHVTGDSARVTLYENVTLTSADGTTRGVMCTTNLFERVESRWLIVHHHASPSPLSALSPRTKPTLH